MDDERCAFVRSDAEVRYRALCYSRTISVASRISRRGMHRENNRYTQRRRIRMRELIVPTVSSLSLLMLLLEKIRIKISLEFYLFTSVAKKHFYFLNEY